MLYVKICKQRKPFRPMTSKPSLDHRQTAIGSLKTPPYDTAGSALHKQMGRRPKLKRERRMYKCYEPKESCNPVTPFFYTISFCLFKVCVQEISWIRVYKNREHSKTLKRTSQNDLRSVRRFHRHYVYNVVSVMRY